MLSVFVMRACVYVCVLPAAVHDRSVLGLRLLPRDGGGAAAPRALRRVPAAPPDAPGARRVQDGLPRRHLPPPRARPEQNRLWKRQGGDITRSSR